MSNETRYHFLVNVPGSAEKHHIVAHDVAVWLGSPHCNAQGATFHRLIGIAHNEDGNWVWKSDDFESVSTGNLISYA